MEAVIPFDRVPETAIGLSAQYRLRNRLMYWLILAGIIGTGIALPLTRVTVHLQGRGWIGAERENAIIQNPVAGTVLRPLPAAHSAICTGDTLLVLNAPLLQAERKQLQKQYDKWKWQAEDWECLLSNNEFTGNVVSDLVRREQYQFMEKIRQYEREMNYLEDELAIKKELLRAGAVALTDVRALRHRLHREQAERSAFEAASRLQWEQARQRALQQLETVRPRLIACDEQLQAYTIIAMIDGTLHQTQPQPVGSYLSDNQVLGHIVPESPLRVEIFLPPEDIGLIRTGMPVAFQIDAFPPNQWGRVGGKVASISPDVLLQENRAVFRVQCHLNETTLYLPDGFRGTLKKGMSLTANFVLRRRSLWQLLTDKMEDWIDPALSKTSHEKAN